MRATWEQVHECADLTGQPGQLGAQSAHSGHAGLALGDTGPRASVFLAGSSGLLLKGDPGVERFFPFFTWSSWWSRAACWKDTRFSSSRPDSVVSHILVHLVALLFILFIFKQIDTLGGD